MAEETSMAFVRRNIAVIVAVISLLSTVTFGFASYRLLEYRVAELETISQTRAASNLALIRETRGILDSHLAATTSHMDMQKWQLLMDRLNTIEAKLDRIR